MSQKFERGSIVTNKNGDEFDCKVVILVTGDRSTSDRHFSGVCIQTYNKKIHPVGDFSTTWHLSKFVKLHDSLEEWQNESPAEQPVREVEFVIAYTPCLEDDPDYCGDYTSNDGRELCHLKEIRVPVSAIKQLPAEWSEEKEGNNG